eukprot:Gb_26787 [translate_table: standard]
MGEEGSPLVDAKWVRMIPIFVDTNLDTHLALSASPSDTVGDLRGKIRDGHLSCFPHLGDIDVGALMVKRKSLFYHLVDSMLVDSIFHCLKGTRFLLVEVSRSEFRTVQGSPRPDITKLEKPIVLRDQKACGQLSNSMQCEDAIEVRQENALRNKVFVKEPNIFGGDETFGISKTIKIGEVQRLFNEKLNGNLSEVQTRISVEQKDKSDVECSQVQEGCGQLSNNMNRHGVNALREEEALRNEGLAKESKTLGSSGETLFPCGKERRKKNKRKELHDLSEGLSGQVLLQNVEESKKKRKRNEIHAIAECSSEQVLEKIETDKDLLARPISRLEKVSALNPSMENNATNKKKVFDDSSTKEQKLLGSIDSASRDAEDEHAPNRCLSKGKDQENSSRNFEQEDSPCKAEKESKQLQGKIDDTRCDTEKRVEPRRKMTSISVIVDNDQEVSANLVSGKPQIADCEHVVENNSRKTEERQGVSITLKKARDAASVHAKCLDASNKKENHEKGNMGKRKSKHSSNDLSMVDSPEGIVTENLYKNDIIVNSCRAAGGENVPDAGNENGRCTSSGNGAVTCTSMRKSKKNVSRDLDANMESRVSSLMNIVTSPGSAGERESERKIAVENGTHGLLDNQCKKLKRSGEGLPKNHTIEEAPTEKIFINGCTSISEKCREKMGNDTTLKVPSSVSTEPGIDVSGDPEHNLDATGSTPIAENEHYIQNDTIMENGSIGKCDNDRKKIKCSKNNPSKSRKTRTVSIENRDMDKLVSKSGNFGRHRKEEKKKPKGIHSSSENVSLCRNGISDDRWKHKQAESYAACADSGSQSLKDPQGNDYAVRKHQSLDQYLVPGRNNFADIGHSGISESSHGSDTSQMRQSSRQKRHTDCRTQNIQSASENSVRKSACEYSVHKSSEEHQDNTNSTEKHQPTSQKIAPEGNITENFRSELKQAESSAMRDGFDTSQPSQQKQGDYVSTQKLEPKGEDIARGKNNTANMFHKQKQPVGSIPSDGFHDSQSSEEQHGSDCAFEKHHSAEKAHNVFNVNKSSTKDTVSSQPKRTVSQSKDDNHAKKNRRSLFKSVSDESTEEEDNESDSYAACSSSKGFSGDSSDSLDSDAGSRGEVSKSQSVKTQADWEPSTSGAFLSTALGSKQKENGESGPMQSKIESWNSKRTDWLHASQLHEGKVQTC